MKKLIALLLMSMAAVAVVGQTTTLPPDAKLSPAERSMAQANRLIEKNPKNFEAYNALALALSRRARESSDVKFYAQAEETLKKSFEISPGNFDGERIQVLLLLGEHEFASARERARKLNQKMPDDVMVYGFLTDANIELGNYKEAEDAAQLMLDLRPGNLPGLTRAAYLRELFGDLDGSVELMNMAYQSTPPSETEDRAWILSQIAHLQLMSGKITEADNTLQQALALFPGYHYALGNLAKVRIEQKRYEDAVNLLQQRYDAAQHAENLYDLAGEIVRVFGFDFDHAFGFYSKLTGDVFGSPVKYELFADMGESEARSVKRTRIVEAFPTVGAKMTFLFDYGDNWQFRIEAIGQNRKEPGGKYPASQNNRRGARAVPRPGR